MSRYLLRAAALGALAGVVGSLLYGVVAIALGLTEFGSETALEYVAWAVALGLLSGVGPAILVGAILGLPLALSLFLLRAAVRSDLHVLGFGFIFGALTVVPGLHLLFTLLFGEGIDLPAYRPLLMVACSALAGAAAAAGIRRDLNNLGRPF